MKLTSTIFALALTFASADAFAEKLAALQYDIGNGVDALVRGDVETSVSEAATTAKWTFVDPGAARGQLNPIVRDCFTNDCLVKAGQQVGAAAGLRLKFTGEAQIYDWTIETFDLRNGSLLASRKGACELCGRSEVVRTFKSSVAGVIAETKLGAATTKPADTKPVVTKPVDTKPVDTKPVDTKTPPRDVQLVTIQITTEPPDTRITFRDAEIGRGRAVAEVGPGSHEFVFEAEGHRIVKEMVVVENDTTPSMSLRVHLPKKDAAAVPVEVTTRGPVDQLGDDRNLYGWIGVGSGAGLLALSMYLAAIDGEPTCDGASSECAELYDTDGLAFVTTLTGTTLLVTGATLLVWEMLAGDDDPAAVKVAPTVTPQGAGIGVFGRF